MHLHINTRSMMTSSEANDQSPKDLNNHRTIINRKMLYCKRPSWISQLRVEVKKTKKLHRRWTDILRTCGASKNSYLHFVLVATGKGPVQPVAVAANGQGDWTSSSISGKKVTIFKTQKFANPQDMRSRNDRDDK